VFGRTSRSPLGATLSGIFRVRDRLTELDDLRSFWPAMRIQPLIGATAGLVTLLILEGGAVKLDGTDTSSWAARALLTFVAGFSEPFFLGLVQRVAVVPDKVGTTSRRRALTRQAVRATCLRFQRFVRRCASQFGVLCGRRCPSVRW
jgi:hypothetical protein